jgi:hypothetical protein
VVKKPTFQCRFWEQRFWEQAGPGEVGMEISAKGLFYNRPAEIFNNQHLLVAKLP